MSRPPHPRAWLAALAAGAVLLVAGCSEPPPPAPEPTGAELERAWRIAVGSDPLDQTIAQLYAQALNAHDRPAAVVEDTEADVTELAAALGDASTQAPADDSETPAEGSDASAEGSADDRYEIVLARTVPLAQRLDPEGYAELTEDGGEGDLGPAAAPADVTDVIDAQLSDAQLLNPAPAVLRSSMLITSITATDLGAEPDDDPTVESLGTHCSDLTIGVRTGHTASQDLLEEVYDCQPQQWVVQEEDALIQGLITAELDAALMTSSHPAAAEHALTSLEDSQRAFTHDQYAPVVASRIAERIPEVVADISAALDEEALVTLRRLIRGEQGLTPEEAAEYWLVQNEFIAEPEVWG